MSRELIYRFAFQNNKIFIREGEIGMRAVIDQKACTGCELCTLICPEVFKMESSYAVAYSNPVPKAYEEYVRESSYDCPVNIIMIE